MTLKASLMLVAIAAAFTNHGCPPSPQPPPPDASDAAPPVPPPPPPAPPSDAGPMTMYNLACAALALAGCQEGAAANCPTAMQAQYVGHISAGLDPNCIAACHDKSCIRACGAAVKCP